jgi:hypothetical protein
MLCDARPALPDFNNTQAKETGMSKMTAAAVMAPNPFDPITLSGERKAEWHLRVDEAKTQVAGIDIRYSVGIDLPGILCIDQLEDGELRMPQNIFNPSVTVTQGAKDAVEILGSAGLRAQVANELGDVFLRQIDIFASKIRARYLN